MGRKGVSSEMGGVTSGKLPAFGGVEVQLPIAGPAGADVKGVLENIMAVTGAMSLTLSAQKRLFADKWSGRPLT